MSAVEGHHLTYLPTHPPLCRRFLHVDRSLVPSEKTTVFTVMSSLLRHPFVAVRGKSAKFCCECHILVPNVRIGRMISAYAINGMCYKEHDCTVFYKNVYAVVICEDCAKDELIEITLRKERVKK
jgi:hypothetical protein